MATKSSLERTLERQRKEAQKAAKEQKRAEQATARRETAQAIIANTATYVSGSCVMDEESEVLLQEILNQYDGNERNYVNFSIDNLPRHITDSIMVGYEKLKQYGVVSEIRDWVSGSGVTLSETGKKYFENKEAAYKRAADEQENAREMKEKKDQKQYDVFISHASKDKLAYVDELYIAVRKLGINIFYDSEVISWGDNWKQAIYDGTDSSEFAIIVISKNFFSGTWTKIELQEFFDRQNETGQKIILPLLYDVSIDEFKAQYPELAEIQCIEVEKCSKELVTILLAKELIKRYKS